METEAGYPEAHLPMAQSGARRAAGRGQLATGELGTGNNLDKVRDLLFGAQMRDVEKGFARLEERLQKDLTELKDETRGRFESLEGFVKREMEALSEQLRLEQNARQSAVESLTRELKELAKTFEQRTNQAEEHIVKTQRDLRQHILDQSRTLRDEFWDRYRELSAATEQSLQDLRAEKTDRGTLAVLLTELAMRLGNDYLLPGDE
ncbi:MAG: hypothetical protein AB7N91_17890 [Candidatus Tectimicrobiota bacterium]